MCRNGRICRRKVTPAEARRELAWGLRTLRDEPKPRGRALLNARIKLNWLPLLRDMVAAGEARDLNEAMLRLAVRAADMHRAELLERGTTVNEEERAHGWARGCVVPATDSGTVSTEASR